MSPQELLDHVLGLDEDAQAPIDAESAATIRKVRRRIEHLLDDQDTPEPPRGLALRTMQLVDASRRTATAPRRRTLGDLMPATVPFRWADVAVAAGIFIAGTLAIIPANHRSIMQASQLACLSNLQQLGTGLNRYAAAHNAYPYPDPDQPFALNGCFIAILNDEELLDPQTAKALHCPCTVNHHGPHPTKLPHMDELPDLHQRSPEQCQRALWSDYAYHRGIQDAKGRPEPVPARLLGAAVPLLSDQPAYDQNGRILPGNSPNHGGGGQNVLFHDGHAAWRRLRWVSDLDRDIFLNQHGLPAPGVNVHDSALGPSILPVISR
jgi:hypothetical protein